jgi:hypothetical protein
MRRCASPGVGRGDEPHGERGRRSVVEAGCGQDPPGGEVDGEAEGGSQRRIVRSGGEGVDHALDERPPALFHQIAERFDEGRVAQTDSPLRIVLSKHPVHVISPAEARCHGRLHRAVLRQAATAIPLPSEIPPFSLILEGDRRGRREPTAFP